MTDPQAAITLSDLTVVIVTYNSAHCVPALAEGLQGVGRVVVVDNASDDDTVARVRAQMAQARLLAAPNPRLDSFTSTCACAI